MFARWQNNKIIYKLFNNYQYIGSPCIKRFFAGSRQSVSSPQIRYWTTTEMHLRLFKVKFIEEEKYYARI